MEVEQVPYYLNKVAITKRKKVEQVPDPRAEIPALMTISNYCKHQKNPYEHGPLIGLAIPLMWIDDEVDYMHDDPLNNGIQENRGKGPYLVPGSWSNPWKEEEEAILIIALYRFGKRFDLVKRFIGTRTMGDILSFYYGKFCKADQRKRWLEWRKLKSNKSVVWENLFQLSCRHKILSCLRPNLTQEGYLKILQVTWLYAESKLNLRDYLVSLTNLVGIDAVDAVVIALKFTKAAPKVPVGEECSRLTHREIMKFLTRFALRRAQSNDLFWNAVWPRLLKRGWQLEQQQGSHGSAASSSSHKYLFFAPEVETLSGKLEKGNHYFDSTSDVLSKVVSNPEIIEYPTKNASGNGREEAMTLYGENSPVIVTRASTGIYFFDNVNTQEAEQGNDTIGKGKGVASVVSTRRKITRRRQPTTKVLEALESKECHPIENRKRSNSLRWNSAAMPSRNTRARVAGESSRSNAKGRMSKCCA